MNDVQHYILFPDAKMGQKWSVLTKCGSFLAEQLQRTNVTSNIGFVVICPIFLAISKVKINIRLRERPTDTSGQLCGHEQPLLIQQSQGSLKMVFRSASPLCHKCALKCINKNAPPASLNDQMCQQNWNRNILERSNAIGNRERRPHYAYKTSE